MNDCTYSRYAERRTGDYIARFRAPRLASLAGGERFEPSPYPRRSRRTLRQRSLGGLLPARARSQPLRRQGAPGRGAPRLRQPDARMAADWRGLAAAASLARPLAGAGGSVLSDRVIRVERLQC